VNGGKFVVGGERHEHDGDLRYRVSIWSKAVTQPIEIGQIASVKIGVDGLREFGLASAIMRQCQKTDHGAAGLLLAFSRQKRRDTAAAFGTAPNRLRPDSRTTPVQVKYGNALTRLCADVPRGGGGGDHACP
jgi:hypothetical protein